MPAPVGAHGTKTVSPSRTRRQRPSSPQIDTTPSYTPSYTPPTEANIQGLHPSLSQIVNRIISESNGRVTVTSGFRTFEEQQELYQRYLSGSGNLAAKPGTSRHEFGLAVDFGGDLDLAAELAERYGLQNTVPGEPWHYELSDEMAGEVDDNWYSNFGEFDLGGEQNPEEVLLNRLNSITSILGMDPLVDGQPIEIDEFSSPAIQEHDDVNATFPDTFVNTAVTGDIPPENYTPSGSGVDRWREVAIMALDYTNSPREWLPSLMRRMMQESSGDPNAINLWDSNAEAGHPSQGLMQTIPSTFAQYSGELRSRGITDPFANIVASIRYSVDRYGSGPAAWDRQGGY
jgi:D-alanyl-D-alanine carboxypeptidase/Transglycosylase SLT domain